MSTLKTHNLQSPDAGSVNIAMTPNAGMVVTGISTFTGDIDVDGHTNLDNVSIAGVTTFSNNVKFDGNTAGRDVTFIRSSNTLEFANNAILELGNGGSGDCRLFNNGTDTRIINGTGTLQFESDTHEFKDKDNTTTKLRISSSGQVRIYNELYLTDGVPLYLGNSNDLSLFHQSGGSSVIRYNHTVGSLHFRNNINADQMVIDSSGNITFGVSGSDTPITSAAIKNIDGGRDYWNSTKGDYRALRYVAYNGGNSDNMYGIGISNSELEIQSQSAIGVYAGTDGTGTGRRRRRITMNSAGGVSIDNTDSNAVHSMSNYDHGNLVYSHRNNRVLTSNGTGWDGNESTDGADPILILGVVDRAGNSDIGDAYGLCLHSDSQDNNDYGPLIGWSNRSNSGNYNTTYAAIVGQKTGTGIDNNWSSGALHFFTQKPNGYMDNSADLTIDQAGHVMMPRNCRFYALNNSGSSDTADGNTGNISAMFETELVDSNGDYNTGNGRFTAPVDGKYEFHFAALHRTLNSGGGSGELTFYKNGANLSQRSFGYSNIGSGGSSQDHQHLTIHGIFALNAGDYIEVYVHSITSGQDFYTYQGLGYFSGKLLG